VSEADGKALEANLAEVASRLDVTAPGQAYDGPLGYIEAYKRYCVQLRDGRALVGTFLGLAFPVDYIRPDGSSAITDEALAFTSPEWDRVKLVNPRVVSAIVEITE